eukprot:TRINITY_DN3193_c0_g3_i1.p1 TRINITY_DN3193_c0_g3~~TRINITY_DN3193_c0_g3_i1.p1  ORF type:complete len:130 (+),score=43.55 TRINITY_DN3193_c0_g3_i1:31-390(+)
MVQSKETVFVEGITRASSSTGSSVTQGITRAGSSSGGNNDTLLTCDQCGVTFKRKFELNKHIITTHTSTPNEETSQTQTASVSTQVMHQSNQPVLNGSLSEGEEGQLSQQTQNKKTSTA